MNKNFYLCYVKKRIFLNNFPNINLKQSSLLDWVYDCLCKKAAKIKRLDINFITEDKMLTLNRKHLNHNEYTDILTFNYNEHQAIESEIFICFDRACENSKTYSETIENEVLRLISHGLLHIFGMRDNTKALRDAMTKEEDVLIRKFHVKHSKIKK